MKDAMTTHSTVPPLTLSFMGANYVAAELGYGAADEWGPFDEATNAAFEPIATFEERFDAVAGRISAAGFDVLDLWLAHLNWRWATPRHVEIVLETLDRHGLTVASLAGNFGATAADLDQACALANALGVDLLGGMGAVLGIERDDAVAILRERGVRFGWENHPERSPAEVLELLGDADDVLGAAVDTGWWATWGFDPADAIEALSARLFHVHLKDIERAGEHTTCPHGSGVVDIDECVDVLVEAGYDGVMSIEHEPYDHDPTDECVRMRDHLARRLAVTRGGAR
jgi:sugar phosphate isomerase/epimerase